MSESKLELEEMMEKMKGAFIDISQIPQRRAHWEELFWSIPPGKALMLRDVAPSTVRAAVARCKKRGLFPKMRVVLRSVRCDCVVYVLNEEGRGEKNE